MLCAHASCERELAGILRWHVPAAPNSNRWGLGRLIRVGRERNWFGADLELRLQSVNENRRTLYPARAHRVPTLAAIIDRREVDVLVDAADVGERQAFPFTL